MTVTYDLSTAVGKCRLLAADTDVSQPVFSDEEWQAFLDWSGENAHLAAASGLEAMATDASKVAIVTRRDSITTDPTQVGKMLRESAAALRVAATSALGGAGTFVESPDAVFIPGRTAAGQDNAETTATEGGNLEPW